MRVRYRQGQVKVGWRLNGGSWNYTTSSNSSGWNNFFVAGTINRLTSQLASDNLEISLEEVPATGPGSGHLEITEILVQFLYDDLPHDPTSLSVDTYGDSHVGQELAVLGRFTWGFDNDVDCAGFEYSFDQVNWTLKPPPCGFGGVLIDVDVSTISTLYVRTKGLGTNRYSSTKSKAFSVYPPPPSAFIFDSGPACTDPAAFYVSWTANVAGNSGYQLETELYVDSDHDGVPDPGESLGIYALLGVTQGNDPNPTTMDDLDFCTLRLGPDYWIDGGATWPRARVVVRTRILGTGVGPGVVATHF